MDKLHSAYWVPGFRAVTASSSAIVLLTCCSYQSLESNTPCIRLSARGFRFEIPDLCRSPASFSASAARLIWRTEYRNEQQYQVSAIQASALCAGMRMETSGFICLLIDYAKKKNGRGETMSEDRRLIRKESFGFGREYSYRLSA
jgi:hypothetical protein